MIDQLGGWSRETIGQGYGEGYDLINTHPWLIRIGE